MMPSVCIDLIRQIRDGLFLKYVKGKFRTTNRETSTHLQNKMNYHVMQCSLGVTGFFPVAYAGRSNYLKGLFMAIGWLTVLKIVPWTDVISNAPVVADGAKKLWNAVAKKTSNAGSDSGFASTSSHESLLEPSLVSLQMQLTATESVLADLRQQMLASSELIKALAEQNTQLNKRVKVNQVRLLFLAVFTVALAVFVVVTRT